MRFWLCGEVVPLTVLPVPWEEFAEPALWRLHHLHRTGSFFVLKAKSNTRLRRFYSRSVDRTTGLICNRVVRPSGVPSRVGLNSPDLQTSPRFFTPCFPSIP